MKETQGKKSNFFNFVKNALIDFVIAALLASCLLYFIGPTVVKQSSMENTLHENDYLLLSKQAYRHNPPERGDIVVFSSNLLDEKGHEKLLIKRVIGLPGDTIKISNGNVFVNNKQMTEDYVYSETNDGTIAVDYPKENETFTVPKDMYYVMGDHRSVSVDSRYKEVGCITVNEIVGKVFIRLFPFNKISTFK